MQRIGGSSPRYVQKNHSQDAGRIRFCRKRTQSPDDFPRRPRGMNQRCCKRRRNEDLLRISLLFFRQSCRIRSDDVRIRRLITCVELRHDEARNIQSIICPEKPWELIRRGNRKRGKNPQSLSALAQRLAPRGTLENTRRPCAHVRTLGNDIGRFRIEEILQIRRIGDVSQ